jgi:tetratricopeptide (TPR) repeat protein
VVDSGPELVDRASVYRFGHRVYAGRDAYERALRHAEKAEQYRRRDATGEPDVRLAYAAEQLGRELLHGLKAYELALLAYGEAADAFRRLGTDADLPRLCSIQGVISAALHDLRRYDEALAAWREHMALCRRLAELDPELYPLDRVPGNLFGTLAKLEPSAAAVDAAAEALANTRWQVANPDIPADARDESDVARALARYAEQLARMDRHEEALAATAEAVEFWRGRVEEKPSWYAEELDQLGRRLAAVGRYEEAARTASDLVAFLREMPPGPDSNPHLLVSALSSALSNHSNRLAGLGRYHEALAAGAEAVELARAQAATPHGAKMLPRVLRNYDVGLSRVGRFAEASAIADETVELTRRLVDDDPEEFTPLLVDVLHNQSVSLDRAGRLAAAREAATEAVTTGQRLVAAAPARHNPRLAGALGGLAMRESALGRHAEAMTASEAAVALYRRLAELNPVGFDGDLADALDDHATIGSRLGHHDRAGVASAESVRLFRRLAATRPGRYAAGLAHSLTTFAEVRLTARVEQAAAVHAAQEAVDGYERLAERLPDAVRADLDRARKIQAALRSRAGRSG